MVAMGIGWKGAPCMLVALGLDSSFMGKAAFLRTLVRLAALQ